MGAMIILVVLPVISFLFIALLRKTIGYIGETKDYTFLFLGFILSLIEIITILIIWKIEGSVYGFSIIFTPFGWIVVLSILTFILSFFSNSVVKKISNLLSMSTFFFILLALVLFFTSSTILEVLKIKEHY